MTEMSDVKELKPLIERWLVENCPDFDPAKPKKAFRCFVHNERTGSMIYNGPDSEQPYTVHCFGGCGFHGDIFSIFAKLQGLSDFPSQVRAVCEWAGADPAQYIRGKKRGRSCQPKEPSEEEIAAVFESLDFYEHTDVCLDLQDLQHNPETAAWLVEHGFSSDTAMQLKEYFKLGLTYEPFDYARLVVPAGAAGYFTLDHWGSTTARGQAVKCHVFNLDATLRNPECSSVIICDRVDETLACTGSGYAACAFLTAKGLKLITELLRGIGRKSIVLNIRDDRNRQSLIEALEKCGISYVDTAPAYRAEGRHAAALWETLYLFDLHDRHNGETE